VKIEYSCEEERMRMETILVFTETREEGNSSIMPMPGFGWFTE